MNSDRDQNTPQIDDAVLGENTNRTDAVLGGIGSVKTRLSSKIPEERKNALLEALNYGDEGVALILQDLKIWDYSARDIIRNLFLSEIQRSRQGEQSRIITALALKAAQQTIHQINSWYLLEPIHRIESLVISSCRIAITSDGLNLVIPGKKQGETSIQNLQTGVQHRVLRGSSYAFVTAIAISTDDTLIACITTSELSVWEFDTGRKIASFYRAKSGVHPEQTCQSLVFSADNRYLIVGEKDSRRSDNGTTTADIVVWDLQTETECYRLPGNLMASYKPAWNFWVGGLRNAVNAMALSPDGKWLVSGWEDGTLSVWDWQNRQKLYNTQMNHEATEGYSTMEDGISYPATRRFNAPIYAVAISPDGTKIVSAGKKSKIKVWNLENGGLISDLTEPQPQLESSILAIAISHDSKTIFTGDWVGIVKIWDLETGEFQHSFQAHPKALCSIAVSPYGRTIVTASENRTVQIWINRQSNRDRSTENVAPTSFEQALQQFANPDLREKLAALPELLNSDRGLEVLIECLNHEFPKVQENAFALLQQRFNEQPNPILKKALQLYNPYPFLELLRTIEVTPHAIAISRDGRTLAIGSGNSYKTRSKPAPIYVYEVMTGQLLCTLTGLTYNVCDLAFSSDGNLLTGAAWDGTVRFWDLRSAQELQHLQVSNTVRAMVIDPNWRVLVTSNCAELMVLSLQTGKVLHRLEFATYKRIFITADAQRIIAVSNYRVHIFDVQTGAPIYPTFPDDQSIFSTDLGKQIYMFAVSPDERIIAVNVQTDIHAPNVIQIWDIEAGKLLTQFSQDGNSIHRLEFSLDGKVLFGTYRNFIRIWDWHKNECIHTLETKCDVVYLATSAIARDHASTPILVSGGHGNLLEPYTKVWGLEELNF